MIDNSDIVKQKLGVDCVVNFPDGTITCLNPQLILGKNLNSIEVNLLKTLHVEKHMLFEKMKATDDAAQLRDLAQQVEQVEFALQAAWGFPQDKNYHEWYLVPKCTCAKLDNRERRGTPYGVTNGNCPIHGWSESESN